MTFLANPLVRKILMALGGVLIAALALIAAYYVGDGDGYARRDSEQAEIERKALEKARQADAVAGETVRGATDEVERDNEEAREAASGSVDPLKSGLDSLRRKKAGLGSPAR